MSTAEAALARECTVCHAVPGAPCRRVVHRVNEAGDEPVTEYYEAGTGPERAEPHRSRRIAAP